MSDDNDNTLGFTVNPDTDEPEDDFRAEVRNILDLSHLSRDAQILEELRKLKDKSARNMVAAEQVFRATELPAITGAVNATAQKPRT